MFKVIKNYLHNRKIYKEIAFLSCTVVRTGFVDIYIENQAKKMVHHKYIEELKKQLR